MKKNKPGRPKLKNKLKQVQVSTRVLPANKAAAKIIIDEAVRHLKIIGEGSESEQELLNEK